MKRENAQSQLDRKKLVGSGKGKSAFTAGSGASLKEASGKMWIDEETAEATGSGGMDELLAVLGYKVRSSDMEEVAQKLEQLEMILGMAAEDGISHLSTDTVHYNPSDLSGWLQNMLSKLDTSFPPTSQMPSMTERPDSRFPASTMFGGDDLRAIPGVAAYPQPREVEVSEEEVNRAKRMRLSCPAVITSTASASPQQKPWPEVSRPVVLADTQETGVCLVHALLACAEAVQKDNLKLADALVKRVRVLAASQPGAMRKVAVYFSEALAHRIYKNVPSYSDSLETHFYDACPYLKFAHFTANQAILEAFGSASRVHVVDFSLKQGMQWPPLLQALALRPGGPPTFRLTGVGDNADALKQVGWRLSQLADSLGVDFEFRGIVVETLAEITPELLDARTSEVVSVNAVFDFHRLLARPGEIEKVLSTVKLVNPKILTILEMEANHNGENFLDRFTQALHYYSSLFDSLEASAASASPPEQQDILMSEVYLGQQICNVVACEGTERVERHETLAQWRTRMEGGGFQSIHIGSDAYRQASMLLEHFAGGDGYRVEESNGCLMLGWHTRPLIVTSAWRAAAK